MVTVGRRKKPITKKETTNPDIDLFQPSSSKRKDASDRRLPKEGQHEAEVHFSIEKF